MKNFKELFMDIKTIRDDIRDFRKDLSEVKEFSSKITKQFKLVASRDDVVKLEKYIDLWNPMDFITRTELFGEKLEKINNETDIKKSNKLITFKDLEEMETRVRANIKKDISIIIENFLKSNN